MPLHFLAGNLEVCEALLGGRRFEPVVCLSILLKTKGLCRSGNYDAVTYHDIPHGQLTCAGLGHIRLHGRDLLTLPHVQVLRSSMGTRWAAHIECRNASKTRKHENMEECCHRQSLAKYLDVSVPGDVALQLLENHAHTARCAHVVACCCQVHPQAFKAFRVSLTSSDDWRSSSMT